MACGALALFATALVLAAAAAPLLHSFWVYLLFRPLCHQQAGRSFWIAGAPMALCARCLGIYLGAMIGLALAAAGGRLPAKCRRHNRYLLAAAVLLAADVITEWLGLRPAWAPVRMLTGMLAGCAAAPLAARALDDWLLDPLPYNRGGGLAQGVVCNPEGGVRAAVFTPCSDPRVPHTKEYRNG